MSDTQEPMPIERLLEHAPWARRLARTLVWGEVAEDVVQQAWLLALERPPSAAAPARAWLAGVLRRVAAHVRRDHARRRRRERLAARPESSAADDPTVERARLQHRLVAHVLALEEPYRSAILMRYLERLPPREIARRQDVVVDTVKTRLKRGLNELRARLDREHGGDRRRWQAAL